MGGPGKISPMTRAPRFAGCTTEHTRCGHGMRALLSPLATERMSDWHDRARKVALGYPRARAAPAPALSLTLTPSECPLVPSPSPPRSTRA